ncbi:UDP-N-acetylmuramate dehydrogenase [Larkinella arboricola]|uniref:UDP-N-acetylenolpyruvoylglucosamine reductase n=1 Tax=Larkinella arboricola TaxID=643671 RepID=A0A327X3K7_LARAB|nr:UDP-N-acetylmuramate dehydrogenase [Larkinella arboricola]RAJ97538.1 UDP-N-acetylmuramate dehydrogenase [Larkinella arboricola]
MLDIQSHVSLKPYNTFGIDAKARYWVEIQTEEQLKTLFQLTEFLTVPKLVLGGGSNLVFTRDFDGLAIKMAIQGIEVVREDESHVYIKAGAGVNWHQLVMHCVENGYAGIENLSLIPGTTGAAPMQNIGAYGVEIEQVFDQLEAVAIQTGETRVFTHAECRFSYRESVFKHEAKGQYIISSVTLRLNKQAVFHVEYGAIRETLAEMGISEGQLSIKAVSEAVIRIRQSKLPNPAEIGNAGSFFKNPEISKGQFEDLKTVHPMMPGYPTGDLTVKVPAGWLIEQCGWKGKQMGNAGVHSKQALVLVNLGGATGAEILHLAQNVQQSVEEKFGIRLNPEVNMV